MADNHDDEVKTNLVDLENRLNEAFDSVFAYNGRSYEASKGIAQVAQAIIDVRRQRHIEEGRGEMYNTRHNISVPHGRVVNKKGAGNGS